MLPIETTSTPRKLAVPPAPRQPSSETKPSAVADEDALQKMERMDQAMGDAAFVIE